MNSRTGQMARALEAAEKANSELTEATSEFVDDMQFLLSPERVAAIWAGNPDPWIARQRERGQ